MSINTKSFIELRMNGQIKDEEWLKLKFKALHRYLGDIIDYNTDKLFIIENTKEQVNNDIEISTKIILNTNGKKYIIKCTKLKNVAGWDEEQLEKISLLKCTCVDSFRNNTYDLYSGIYSEYTWELIKNKILSNELHNINLLT